MNALFVNGSPEPACGVNQFGKNLYAILQDSANVYWQYCEPSTLGELRTFTAMPEPDVVLYNWQFNQGGFLADAPFIWLGAKQYLVYHDCAISDRFDGIFFADPTMTPRGKWHCIGRPIPTFNRVLTVPPKSEAPIIGCHGFLGAWADQVVHRVMQEFEYAVVRLNLPFSKYCDPDGAQAMTMAERCRNMVVNKPGITLQISHDFLPIEKLLDWLSANHLNCYIRPANMNWTGISSAPDFAIAVRKPLAVNKCNAFRHLHSCEPSICVEDRSLFEIIQTGASPLVPFRSKWCDPERIREQVESVLKH